MQTNKPIQNSIIGNVQDETEKIQTGSQTFAWNEDELSGNFVQQTYHVSRRHNGSGYYMLRIALYVLYGMD